MNYDRRQRCRDRREHNNPYAPLARAAVLLFSAWTAVLQLWQPWSIAFRAAGDSALVDLLSVALLALSGIGWADVFWHDLRGRLIWPSLPSNVRQHACVLLYSCIGIAFGMRAFLSTGETMLSLIIGTYYLCVGSIALGVARAISREDYTRYKPRPEGSKT